MEENIIKIHSLSYTPDKTAIVAKTTQDFGDGPKECDFVYRSDAKYKSVVYYAVEAAIQEGAINIDEPAPIEEPVLTQEDYTKAIQALFEATASSRRYEQGATAFATYVNSKDAEWAAEAQAFVEWRDAVWRYAYDQLDLVQAGKRDQPSVEELLAELPKPNWPE